MRTLAKQARGTELTSPEPAKAAHHGSPCACDPSNAEGQVGRISGICWLPACLKRIKQRAGYPVSSSDLGTGTSIHILDIHIYTHIYT